MNSETRTNLEAKVERLEKLVEGEARPNRHFLKTQAEFDKVPGLISREEFRDWTGLSVEMLDEEVRLGHIEVLRLNKRGYAKYFKREVARLTGFKM